MNIQKQPLTPTPEQDTLIRLLASRYVRRENRFYHIDRPNEALGRKDVELSFISMIAGELPDIAHDPNTMKIVFRTAIELLHSDRHRTIPVWGGQQASVPGNEARLTRNRCSGTSSKARIVTTSPGRIVSVIVAPPPRSDQRQQHESADSGMGSGGHPEDRGHDGLGGGRKKKTPGENAEGC